MLGFAAAVVRLARREQRCRCQPCQARYGSFADSSLHPKGWIAPKCGLLRELELRQDTGANPVFSVLLYTGCRVSDLVNLELTDVMLSDRSGSVVFRFAKGNKQRSVPLPLPARRALQDWLDIRPAVASSTVLVGERGPLTDRGVRALCDKYSAICGIKFYPHLLRHTMAHQFLADDGNDLVSLAQILGHENLNTTKRYVQRTEGQLAEASERMSF